MRHQNPNLVSVQISQYWASLLHRSQSEVIAVFSENKVYLLIFLLVILFQGLHGKKGEKERP